LILHFLFSLTFSNDTLSFRDLVEQALDSNIFSAEFLSHLYFYQQQASISSPQQQCSDEILLSLAFKLLEISLLESDVAILNQFESDIFSEYFAPCHNIEPETLDMVTQILNSAHLNNLKPSAKSLGFVINYCASSADQDFGWLHKLLEKRNNFDVTISFIEKCAFHFLKSDQLEILHEIHSSLNSSLSKFGQVRISVVEENCRSDECSGFFSHIYNEYENPPDVSIFLHPDAYEHCDLKFVEKAIKVRMKDPGFSYLSHNKINLSSERNTLFEEFGSKNLFNKLFGTFLKPSRRTLVSYCCAQFVVSKSIIQRRPREFYGRAAKTFTDSNVYFLTSPFPVIEYLDKKGRTPCQFQMTFWHVIFTGKWNGAEERTKNLVLAKWQ
jgi:Protein of unknown function (DUF3431)